MRRLVAGTAFAVLLVGCAAVQKAMPFLPTPAAIACAATDVEKGIENPITIVSDCPALAEVAAADLEALVMSLLMAKKANREAAMRSAVGEICVDAGFPPPPKTLNFANDNDAGKRSDAGAK